MKKIVSTVEQFVKNHAHVLGFYSAWSYKSGDLANLLTC